MKRLVLFGLLAVVVILAFVLATRRPSTLPDELAASLKSDNSVKPPSRSSAAVDASTTGPNTPAVSKRGTPIAPVNSAWNGAIGETEFAAFREWAGRYAAAATTEAKAALESEGAALARARRAAMAALMESDPKRALELTTPHAVRAGLPGSVTDLLEQRVNATGDYEVLGFAPLPGEAGEITPVVRYAVVDGERHQVFTYGKGLEYITRTGVPLNGIRLPADAAPSAPRANGLPAAAYLMALDPRPARLLEASEIAQLQSRSKEALNCPTSGDPWTQNAEPTAEEIGGKVFTFCGKVHAEDWAVAAMSGASLDTPPPPSNIPTSESSYTEGRKRMLLMRPIWSNYSSVMSTNQALTHFQNFSNYMFEMSYGKLVLAPLGQGSDVTPEMLLPGLVAEYDNSGLGKLYNTCRDVARTNYGYDLSQYDFLYVCTLGSPAAGYAGLAFVGGVGFHLANGYFDAPVSCHEFGHNLGLNHAHFWDTALASIIGNGQNVEYGDNNDPMGGGGSPNSYNSRYKNYLGWIPNSDIADLNVTASGTYRIYCFDLDTSVGLRGLKFTRNTSQNYWVNFRQRKTSKRALMNGVQLLWTGNGNQGSYLLDVRLKGDADDNAIVIGRTFSDPTVGFHFTPVRKGNTFPESMDVVVNTGSFPGNRPPLANVSASSATASPGQSITLFATASDPDGDALAYYWEFDDGDYSIDNSAITTHSFPAAGQYAVQCTVSDMKGGTDRRTVIVTVGSPATYRISGHVLDKNNRPLSGIRVSTDTGRDAFTDSDGSYTIVGLTAGSHSLSAADPLAGALSFAHPFFNNPVAVGPNFTGADFIGVTGSLSLYTTLAPKNGSWLYFDGGVDQGTAWRDPFFDDSGWSSGTAPLGYTTDTPITTVIRYGPDANNKYPTYYFRREFAVADPNAYTNLLLETLRDDGVIVYLNGTEVFRDNMPAGAVTYSTLASSTVEPDAYLQATISTALLVPGFNTLAAEVHQSALNSSDVTFDAALSGLSVSNASQFSLVYLSNPADRAVFTGPTNVTLRAVAMSGSDPVGSVTFYVDGANIGSAGFEPYQTVWNTPSGGTHNLQAVATIGTNQVASPVITVTLSQPVTMVATTPLTLVTTNATWRYLANGAAPPANWASPAYSDSTWLVGNAQFGYGEGDEATVLPYGGDVNNKWISYYFRRPFTIDDPALVTNLSVRLLRDDGGIVYLNGVEVFRSNMPQGPVNYLTLANNAADDGKSIFGSAIDRSLLVPGTNLIAVEIHQDAVSSSDVSFALGLDAQLVVLPRGVYLTAPAEGASFTVPTNLTLRATTSAGSGAAIISVEFFDNGVSLGTDPLAPYSVSFLGVAPGTHQIVAVATDTLGATLTSAPVNFTLTAPAAGTALVSMGDVWLYHDDGLPLPSNWVSRTYDDRLWNSGPARLGYGGDGELTTVSYGQNPNAKHVTTYFRRTFNAPLWSPIFTGLRLDLIRDDGVVVYLNGVEVYRDNLLPGLVGWNSLATATVEGAAESAPIEAVLGTAGLMPGTNVLAVEIHQASPSSSDLGFDLSFTGLIATNPVAGILLTSPADGAHFNAPGSVPLSAYAVSPQLVTLVEYFDGATKIGEATLPPYAVTWNNPAAGTHTITARATYGAGGTATSWAISIQVGDPPRPVAPVFDVSIPARSAWKYWDSAAAPGAGWEKGGFDDATWGSGLARFGFGLDGEVTPLSEGRATYYFRRWFTVTNPAVLSQLVFQLARDDGAVVYLNGVEVFRSNMPDGPITASTLALATVNTPDETAYFEHTLLGGGSGLLTGSNLVAVELHQASPTSSDAGFDLQLLSYGTTDDRVVLADPAANATYHLGDPIPIEAFVWTGGTRTVSRVEFLLNGGKIGETATAPYQFGTTGSSYGTMVFSACAVLSDGTRVDSLPVTVSVSRQAVNATLISSNSVWRFLDTGVNLGTAWSRTNYVETGWKTGAARLGYGGDGEVTVVSYGANMNSKYITTYFRKSFTVPPGYVYTNLTFRLVRDDGAVVYLNGVELYRSNMPDPPATITYTTLASAGVANADEQAYFTTVVAVPPLHQGTNVIAVEVHQNAVTSSDLGFILELAGSGYLMEDPAPALAVRVQDGQIELSWPVSAVGWQLYSSPNAVGPSGTWTPVGGAPPTVVSGRYVISLPMSAAQEFFRLGRP